ncbi:MAG: choice-of-anchor E domain-containing protein [Euryarchaeota archaeon]|nr:choice-of-anchor E domain-containing protein [Euryarchaeota archaeon]
MKERKMALLLAVLALILFIPSMMPAAAQGYSTVVYCDEVPTKITDWTKSFTLPKFDPSLGTLLKVNLTFDLNITQDISFENKGSGAGTVAVDSEGVLLVTMPDSEMASVNVSRIFSEDLEAFDGVRDFSGPSGCNITGVTFNESVTRSYADLPDFTAGFPGETIAFPVTATVRSMIGGPGDYISMINTRAGSKVCVVYTYEP